MCEREHHGSRPVMSKAFKGHFMKIEASNGFVEKAENSRCHFGLGKAICCQRRRHGGLSYMLLSAREELSLLLSINVNSAELHRMLLPPRDQNSSTIFNHNCGML